MEAFQVQGWKEIEIWEVPYKTFYLYRMPPEMEKEQGKLDRPQYQHFDFTDGT